LQEIAACEPTVARLLGDFPMSGVRDVFQLQRDLLTACYIILATFGALRISEAAGLSYNNVIEERSDGPWLNTLILKTSPEDKGSVIPKVVPTVVRTAVRVALDVTATDRGDRQELLLSYNHSSGRTALFTYHVAADRLNSFAARRLGIKGAQWRFASHQLRKLFVQLYVRRFEGSVEAAQQHLGHVSAGMIESYLHDPDILRMVKNEKIKLISEVMSGVMSGCLAAAGEATRAWRAQGAIYKARNMTLAEIAREVRTSIKGKNILLEPTPVGYCLSSAEAGSNARCGLDRKGMPDRANRTDGMCIGCSNSISTDKSESSLKAIYVVHKEVMESPDSAEPMREASRQICVGIQRRLSDLAAVSENELRSLPR
jgi:hypothetical protein